MRLLPLCLGQLLERLLLLDLLLLSLLKEVSLGAERSETRIHQILQPLRLGQLLEPQVVLLLPCQSSQVLLVVKRKTDALAEKLSPRRNPA